MAGAESSAVSEYLAEIPDDRRELVTTVRATIIENLPEGFEEVIDPKMINYVVPLDHYPDTYNGRPLSAISVANQKNHVAVHLMGVYADEKTHDWFVKSWEATGKKLDMGKSCVRLKRIDEVPLKVLGEAVARVGPEELIAAHEAVHAKR